MYVGVGVLHGVEEVYCPLRGVAATVPSPPAVDSPVSLPRPSDRRGPGGGDRGDVGGVSGPGPRAPSTILRRRRFRTPPPPRAPRGVI